MSKNTVSFSSSTGTASYDFTGAMSQAYDQGSDPMIRLATGKYGMRAGDANANDDVFSVDWATWASDNGYIGYYGADMNLDTSVDALDPNIYWYHNNGTQTQVP
jgi:hypothetical protein